MELGCESDIEDVYTWRLTTWSASMSQSGLCIVKS